MAKNYWRGDSQAVAQRDRFTVGGVAHTGDVLTLTVNGKTVTYALTGTDTLTTAAAALAAAWSSATFPEAGEAAAEYTDPNAYLDLVSTSAGRPFTVTASVTGGGATTTLTLANQTASTGPSHVDEPKNWTLGIPDTTQDVIVDRGAAMLYGLGTVAALSWEFRRSYAGPVGLPASNPSGYAEYRTTRPTLDTATGYIGRGSGGGSPQILFQAVAGSTWIVSATGTREGSIPAVDIGATGNPTSIEVSGPSDVGFIVEDESTARTCGTVKVTGDDAKFTSGRRSTVTTFFMDRGAADAYGVVTTATVGRGAYSQQEGTLSNITAYAGTVNMNHAGTVATVVGQGRGDGQAPVFNCENNNLARTFTASSFTGGATLLDENKTVTLGGGAHTADAAFFAGSRLGPYVNWTRS